MHPSNTEIITGTLTLVVVVFLFVCFSHGVRAPIPQTTGVLIEEEFPPR